jgi:NitT/TauT family transport system permease protein
MKKTFKINYDEDNKYHRYARTVAISVTSLSVFIILWWAASIIADIPPIPTPLETWNALVDLFLNGDKMTHISLGQYVKSSLTTFVKGFLLAFAVAVPIGLLLGYSKTQKEFAAPVLELLRPIAPIAWAPIFIIAIGYEWGAAMTVLVGVFFPLSTNVSFGMRKIDKGWVDAARTLGASKFQSFYKVMLPSTVPYVMNGVKIGMGVGWMCIVAAELYSPPLGGIGFFIASQAQAGYWPGAYAGIVVICALGLLTVGVADYFHRVLSKRMGMDV